MFADSTGWTETTAYRQDTGMTDETEYQGDFVGAAQQKIDLGGCINYCMHCQRTWPLSNYTCCYHDKYAAHPRRVQGQGSGLFDKMSGASIHDLLAGRFASMFDPCGHGTHYEYCYACADGLQGGDGTGNLAQEETEEPQRYTPRTHCPMEETGTDVQVWAQQEGTRQGAR